MSVEERPSIGPSPSPAGAPDLDANQDDIISRAEFEDGGAHMFARLDVNGDGRIEQGEQTPH